MRVLGVTGGVGAGKSTVLDLLEKEFDAAIIKADLVGHEVMEPGGICYEPVIELFGRNILKNDKTIDRKLVSDVVFSEAEKRSALNAIIHPAVKQEILMRIENERQNQRGLCVVEAALLLEDHYEAFCDEVWYIYTEKEIRIQRLMDSRGYTRQKALDIMNSQASDRFFREHTDFVLDNSGGVTETLRQIRERLHIYETL